MSKVRLALIGAGSMANSAHYPSLAGFGDVELAGLCDLNEERLRATAEKFGIPRTFTDYRRMLDEVKPDAAYALMPPHVLFDVAMDVLERGIHLFVEKPLCNTRIQAESLAAAAARKGLVTMVGFQRRYHPALVRCREAVAAHGPLRLVVSTFYKSVPEAVGIYYRGAIDILSCDAVHAVDSLRYFAGGEPVSVSSTVKRLGAEDFDNFHVALVEFDNGVTGVLLTDWLSGKRLLSMEFHCEGAAAFCDCDGSSQVSVDNETIQTFTHAEAAGSDEARIAQGFLAENRAFVDCVKAGAQPHNDFADAVRTWELVEKIYRAAEVPAAPSSKSRSF